MKSFCLAGEKIKKAIDIVKKGYSIKYYHSIEYINSQNYKATIYSKSQKEYDVYIN